MILTKRLKRILRNVCRDNARYDELREKQQTFNLIQFSAEGGKIAMQYSQMDCDGVESRGYEMIPATLMAFRKWVERFYCDSEGPGYFNIVSPSVAYDVKPQTIDRGAMAHEEGHPHSIHC